MRRAALAAAATLVLAACSGGSDDTAEPADVALSEAAPAACATDLAVVQSALDAYEAAEGSPAADEAALVAAGFLREESDNIDVTDGQVFAQVPECAAAVPDAPVPTAPSGSAPLTAPATDVGDIVTSTEPGRATTEAMLATMSELDIASYGGIECATELAAISAAGERFVEREGRNPDDLDELAADLDREISLWAFDAERQILIPADGSPCTDAFSGAAPVADPAAACDAERAAVQAAIDAFVAANQFPPGDEAELVAAGLLPAPSDGFDVVDGTAVAVPGSPCG